MYYVKINSLPTFRFAHVFSADSYVNSLPVSKSLIEISYYAEGGVNITAGEQKFNRRKYSVGCNLFNRKLDIHTSTFHEHHTVCFAVDYTLCNPCEEGAICIPSGIDCYKKEKVHELIDKIILTSQEGKICNLKLGGLFLELLSEINELALKTNTPRFSSGALYVRHAKEYVYKNIEQPITQKEIAAALKITPEYLCSVFKKEEGTTLMNFINRAKLDKIYTLIKHENAKLYQAAYKFGYNDANYVSRLYKKLYGHNITDNK